MFEGCKSTRIFVFISNVDQFVSKSDLSVYGRI